VLVNVLKYHVVPGAAARAASLTSEQRLKTLQGANITVRLVPGANNTTTVRLIGVASTATVTQADVPACKSVVHIIDTVLLPKPLQG
jgi:uncharacterized surface protein with fasciclin (FAS1) repeats